MNGGLEVDGYYVQINSGYGTPFVSTQHKFIGKESTSYTFPGTYEGVNFIAGIEYMFRVSAFNLLEAQNKQFDDELNWSEPASFIIANVPNQITEFKQSTYEYENGKAKLVWTPPYDNGSKILHYTVTRDVGGVYFKVYEGNEANFTDTGLQMGKSYNYKVKAYNLIGYS